ncbi:MAG: hypothetical protein A3C90_04595 [Candidatus Magasanikbacteria bacterium RIFCSPHIGHO2_02_FULL_51_14]|uniref:HTH arsR-type domain-containing protein n=1 Tax=Candidatus Magasanikbacteria bacterium RIFCSPHIGHO2_02_FULL_51_14 TaxID=1798683 RepID=A0A1F6MQC7_9BACT|nr:MAG: hypothetical protein A3C90_04595 [Candidatus Magasanikbacteria bacterium RIFCSPHIGHO2_02_FULL_51_14]
MPTLLETLTIAGMDPKAAEIYLILAEGGEMTMQEILKKTALSRATVYDILPILLAMDYVEYRKEGRVALYKPAHPSKLLALIDQKKRDTALLEEEMKETVRSITGMYNLALVKPGVRFFEGREGFREALYDTFTAKETIYTYIDLEAVQKYADDINREYVRKRREKNIGKRLLVPDTPGNRAYVDTLGPRLTDTRFLPKELKPFRTGMQIYENKISYLSLREKNIMAVIIEDPDIYGMHRNLFEFLWDIAGVQQKIPASGERTEEISVMNE